MQYTTNAINIKSYPLGEGDNILLAYSKTHGLIKCIAKGAKKTKSKLGGRSQVLIANKLQLHKGRNFDKITQAESINTFSKIRQDFDKLSYSLYLADVISIFGSDSENDSEEIYNIFYKSLENIADSKERKDILLNVIKFQISLIRKMGWGIDFKTCAKCGCNDLEYYYYTQKEKTMFCKECSENIAGKLTKFPKKIADFLNEISNSEIGQKTQYDDIINLKTVEVCFEFMKKYLENVSGKNQKFEDFSKCVSLNK